MTRPRWAFAKDLLTLGGFAVLGWLAVVFGGVLMLP